jgi:hypothetical protein
MAVYAITGLALADFIFTNAPNQIVYPSVLLELL